MSPYEHVPARALAELACLIGEHGQPRDSAAVALVKIMRHLDAWRSGAADESGYSHLVWAAYRVLFLLDADLLGRRAPTWSGAATEEHRP